MNVCTRLHRGLLRSGKAQHVFQKLADVGAAEAEIAVFALGHAGDPCSSIFCKWLLAVDGAISAINANSVAV